MFNFSKFVKMRTWFFAILSYLISVLCSSAQTDFQTELQKILQKPEYFNSTVGIQIVDLQTGSALFEMNAGKLMIPASVMKIITSATALEMLGADYRFQTKIGFAGELLKTNELKGDLVISGGGDPTLGSEYFNQLESCRDFAKI